LKRRIQNVLLGDKKRISQKSMWQGFRGISMENLIFKLVYMMKQVRTGKLVGTSTGTKPTYRYGKERQHTLSNQLCLLFLDMSFLKVKYDIEVCQLLGCTQVATNKGLVDSSWSKCTKLLRAKCSFYVIIGKGRSLP
jgi:hypothetical protein